MNWKAVFLVFLIAMPTMLVEVRGQTLNNYFPAVKEGVYFLWQTNSSGNTSFFSGKVTIETRNERLKIMKVTENDTAYYVIIDVYNERYYNNTLVDKGSARFHYTLWKNELAGMPDILGRLFNIKLMKEAIEEYLQGLSAFVTNATIRIYEGYFDFNGNRSVIIGELNGTDTYAKYVVDKEYGVLLAREFRRIIRTTNISTSSLPMEFAITLLKDTNIFLLLTLKTRIIYLILASVIIAVIAAIIIKRRRWQQR